jgi:diacylglycerol kinase (ATP)
VKKKVFFIYNPGSGNQSKLDFESLVRNNLNHEYFDYEVYQTKSGEDLDYISKSVAESAVNLVVAAGGDGTVNRVSRILKNTEKGLYIVPLGSGNGLARHFAYPMKTEKAIQAIQPDMKILEIDCCTMNRHHFINVAGIGFDAHISHVFASKSKRGFKGYFKAVLKELSYKPQFYQITSKNFSWEGKAFLISFANGTQWGNNARIAPDAKIDDGLIEMVVLKAFSKWQIPLIVYQLFFGKVKQSKLFQTHRSKSFTVKRSSQAPVHTDGEAMIEAEDIEIAIADEKVKIMLSKTKR